MHEDGDGRGDSYGASRYDDQEVPEASPPSTPTERHYRCRGESENRVQSYRRGLGRLV